MADEARLAQLLDELNLALGEYTPYKLALVDPHRLQPVEKNAHYMPKRLFDQLVANLKLDRNLSTLPFCWKREDGGFVTLSGNHRVEAAVAAGVARILVLYTDALLSRSEQVGIQLSHNALVGQDNPTLLLELWNEITDLDFKVYTGLDDTALQTLKPANVVRLNEEPLRMEELTILFLQPETERVDEFLKRLGPVARKRYAASAQEFERFFDRLLSFKEAAGIINTGTAFLLMADIVDEWLVAQAETEHNTVEQ